MKLKMLTSMAGRDYSLSPGDEYEFSADEAARLIAAGYAEAVDVKKTVKRGGKSAETATVDAKVESRG